MNPAQSDRGPRMKLVFDFGAVLFRWQPLALIQRALPQRATNEAQARRWAQDIFQGDTGDWGDFNRGRIDQAETVRRIALRTGLGVAEVQGLVELARAELQPLPDSVALLERLRGAGHANYFLSNMPAPFADELVARHAFVRGFDQGVFSGHVGLAKPEPALFSLAAERFGAQPAELVLLDDHEPNVQAARAQGWQALVFSDAAQAERDLRAQGWI
jgi:HAD superfamily hydrolase (TIGR01509 family)